MSQRTHTTDYIVVGAGASGSVIARRLLDRGYSVHVLEAGPADINPDIHASSGWPALLHSAADWAFVTTRNGTPAIDGCIGPGERYWAAAARSTARSTCADTAAITTVGPN